MPAIERLPAFCLPSETDKPALRLLFYGTLPKSNSAAAILAACKLERPRVLCTRETLDRCASGICACLSSTWS